MDSPNVNGFKILMFPWLAHGHIFPFLELAKALTNRKNFHIYICSTPINGPSITKFIDENALNSTIEFVQLDMESTPDLPPHYHTTKNLPSRLNFALIKAFQDSNSQFSDTVAMVKPDLVIYDVFQPWAAKIAASQGNNTPAVYFSIYGAMLLAYAYHRHVFGKEVPFPFPNIRVEDHEYKSLELLFEFLFANVYEADQEFLWGTFMHSRDIILVKTVRGCEGKYLDYLHELCNKKLVPVGPLISDDNKKVGDNQGSEILEWLSKKPEHSTVFISFGSEYFLSNTDIDEISKGLLELINCGDHHGGRIDPNPINFIWIIRFPVGSNVENMEDVLPLGFVNRVGDRGLVVTGWAPQAAILAHPSTGGFMSHCGWSSIVESMYYGVPVIGMPMKVDQPVNARMLEAAGSCVVVDRNEDEGFKGEAIARALRKVFGEETGEAMRGRAMKLRETMKMEKEQVLDEASEQVWKLCLKHKKKLHGEGGYGFNED